MKITVSVLYIAAVLGLMAVLPVLSACGSDGTGTVRYVSGTVSAPDGSPGAGLTVDVQGNKTVTDENGHYTVQGPDSGGFVVIVSGSGGSTAVQVDGGSGTSDTVIVDVSVDFSAGPGTGGGAGGVSGCGGETECRAGEWCLYAIGTCGGTSGTCRQVGPICTADYTPVCGCNGRTYANACSAEAAGNSIRHKGECRN